MKINISSKCKYIISIDDKFTEDNYVSQKLFSWPIAYLVYSFTTHVRPYP